MDFAEMPRSSNRRTPTQSLHRSRGAGELNRFAFRERFVTVTRSIVLVLACIGTSCVKIPQGPALYTSYFGFTVHLSGEWLPVNPQKVAADNVEESLESLGIDVSWDQGTAAAILERIKAGKVEFYFDRHTIEAADKNNITAQVMPYKNDALTREGVAEFCHDLPKQLPAVYGNPAEVSSCGLAEANGVRYLSFEYSVPALSYCVVQDEIPFVNDETLVLAGGTFEACRDLQRLKVAQKALVDGATHFVAERITGGSSRPASLSSAGG